MKTIRVVVAVQHERIRESICRFLGEDPRLQVVALPPDGESVLEAARLSRPHIVLLDLDLPGLSPIEVIRRLHARLRRPRVLVLGLENCQWFVEEVLSSGADGYLLKDDALECLLPAVTGLLNGEKGWVRPEGVVYPSQAGPERGLQPTAA